MFNNIIRYKVWYFYTLFKYIRWQQNNIIFYIVYGKLSLNALYHSANNQLRIQLSIQTQGSSNIAFVIKSKRACHHIHIIYAIGLCISTRYLFARSGLICVFFLIVKYFVRCEICICAASVSVNSIDVFLTVCDVFLF